ncbi:MAG: DUF2064 domain-containing protein [Promethearchaeota archaeon]
MKSAIIIFSKVPIPGLVKTRLVQDTCLTESEGALIAKAMLKDTIILASETKADRIQIGFFPEECYDIMSSIVNTIRVEGNFDKKVELYHQNGLNFDQRFASVVKQSLDTNVDYLVVLGADLPFLDPQIINRALDDLVANIDNKPLIIGPSNGGGIYLVGITKSFNPNWFVEHQLFNNGIELSQFTLFCKKNEFKLIVLPPYGDIDIEEDLVTLISYINVLSIAKETDGFHFPYYTAKIIDKLGIYIVEEQDQTRKRKIAKK